MVKSKDSILNGYQNRVSVQENAIARLKSALNTIAYLRLGAFLTEVAFVAFIISYGYFWLIGILMCIPVIFFLSLLKRQVAVQRELSYTRALHFIFLNEVQLMTTGRQGYADGSQFQDQQHAYTSDLDIFGEASLYALINRANTVRGMQLLADSLHQPSALSDIEARQEAILELREQIEETYHFRAGLQNHKPEQFELIEKTLEGDINGTFTFIRKQGLRMYVKIASVASVLLFIAGIQFGGLAWSFFAILLLANSSIIFFNIKSINVIHSSFSGTSELLSSIADTVKWTERMHWKSKYIRRFWIEGTRDAALSKSIGNLSGHVRSFDVRLNMFLGPLLNAFFLWDLWCTMKLEKWFSSSSTQLLNGMSAISRLEELISFATLSHNEPEWTLPVVTAEFEFTAEALGHPLIPEGKRILNDFAFEKTATVDIVTGSNMAGKSTFLRTVGINMVLAFAGSVVCARTMRSSIFDILTYMRIKDSLNDQTSTFKAELNRLKMILEGVKVLRQPLVLIDEMLRGTNSRDKYLGSRVFIQQMIHETTPTLFATHDLQLSEMAIQFPALIRNYHFDIQIAQGEMQFDYKIKDGACNTFNAAVLLKEIGLSLDNEILS